MKFKRMGKQAMWRKEKGSMMIGPIHVEWLFDVDGSLSVVADYKLIGIIRDDAVARIGETKWNVKAGTFSSIGVIKLKDENGEMTLTGNVSWMAPKGDEGTWEGEIGKWKAVKFV